jgi:hypothetical protein
MSEFSPEFTALLSVLATWRLTHLLVAEDGPLDLVVTLRRWLGDSFFGTVMDCFYCASLWLAAPFAFTLGHSIQSWLLTWLAIAGAAALLEQASQRPPAPLPPSPEPKEEVTP